MTRLGMILCILFPVVLFGIVLPLVITISA
jgi:hypothetical protein